MRMTSDGTVYLPPAGGTMASGDSAEDRWNCDKIFAELKGWQETITQNAPDIRAIARASTPLEARSRYGASIEEQFLHYVDQVVADESMDRKTARAEVQQILGLSRWIREATLYRTIKGNSTIALSMSVEIRYDAPITKIALRRRLSKFIGKAQGFNT